SLRFLIWSECSTGSFIGLQSSISLSKIRQCDRAERSWIRPPFSFDELQEQEIVVHHLTQYDWLGRRGRLTSKTFREPAIGLPTPFAADWRYGSTGGVEVTGCSRDVANHLSPPASGGGSVLGCKNSVHHAGDGGLIVSFQK